MPINRGKDFERRIKEAFEKVPEVSIDRIHDQTTKFKGSTNICDFIVYKKPYEYYIECKSVHGNTLPFSNITETQWKGIDLDETWFIPIWVLEDAKTVMNAKSINLKHPYMIAYWTRVMGKKKRVFFDYDMSNFLKRMENQ